MSDFPFEYGIYGLHLRTNRPLAGFAPPGGEASTVIIDFAGAPLESDVEGEPFWSNGFEAIWHRAGGTWLLRYVDARGDVFWTIEYAADGSRLTVRWSAESLLDDIPSVLQGPGLAAALHLHNVPMLHASVLATAGGAIALIGEPGAGKSTTAAAFVAAGFASMSDDLAALAVNGRTVSVQAGYPRLRAFADSLRAAGYDPDVLPRVFADEVLGPKLYLPLSADDGSFQPGPLPLRAVYYLMTRVGGAKEARIEPLSVRQALPVLLQNLYSTRLLDHARRVPLVRAIAGIAATVPVRAVQAADSLDALPRLVEAIAADASALGAAP